MIDSRLNISDLILTFDQVLAVVETLSKEEQKTLIHIVGERLNANLGDSHQEIIDEQEATLELLNIPGFEAEFREAIEQADRGEVVSFESIRRHV